MLSIILLIIATTTSIMLLGRTTWALKRYAYRPLSVTRNDIPTVSVCIAARNEMHALARCLEAILKSDYPKLEILVLDDSSDDDTSLIIKSFAGAGVRFIAGKPLPPGWLGKNHAYQMLLNEASGELVLFMDVDTAVKVSSITQLVDQLIENDKTMVSVLPRREDTYRLSALFGTFRYYWELLLSQRDSPPTSSALWLADRSRLKLAGMELSDYGLSVRPEKHIARKLQQTKDYYYLIGTSNLGISYEKRTHSQHETAIRLYYPLIGRRFSILIVVTLFLLSLLMPFYTLLFSHNLLLVVWSIAVLIVIDVSFGAFVYRTHSPINWQFRLLSWPLLLVREIVLLLLSYSTYRYGIVTWKGRPVASASTQVDALDINE